MEAIKAATIGDKLRPFLFEHLPHRPVRTLGMGMHLGVSDAFVHQPGIQFVVALHPQSWSEEALAHQADLVLDLALLPTRGWCAGDRVDQMMCTHLQKAAVILSILANEDSLHRRLHVVVDAACAGAL